MNPLPHHKGKLIIVSAPSGAGKTTLVQHLLQNIDRLGFSVSCTTRSPRHNETDGKDYYFISTENFQKKIEREEFAEWEEVYPDTFYGTLKSEIQRIIASGNSVIFDIDVMGGIRLKELYSDDALSIFIMPPSLEVLENRLRNRKTESEEKLRQRVDKARKEINMATRFDLIILNDNLPTSQAEILKSVLNYLEE
jgi:guanylate kinase